MLQAIRDRATGWIAYGIVGFLVIPFAFWGIDQYQGGGVVHVAEVDGNEIPLQEFQRAFQERQARLQAVLGDRFDPADFDETLLKKQVLDELVVSRLMTSMVYKDGYRIGDEQLGRAIHGMTPFQVDGRFDAGRYEEILRQQGMSKTGFEESMRQDLARMQIHGGISGSFAVTDDALDRIIALRNQRREVAYVLLSLDAFLATVSVTEEDLQAWFADNASRFVAPEKAKVQYLELSVETLAEQQAVDENALLSRYEEQKDRFTKPPLRRASHILVRLEGDADDNAVESAREQAQGLYEQIESGTLSFDDAMAKAAGDSDGMLESGDLGALSPGMMDQRFEQALYGLAEVGAVSEPVRTDFGFHLIRLDGEEPGGIEPFEEVRDALIGDAKREFAEGVFFELSDQLANIAYESPNSLEPAAEATGLEVKVSQWFTRESGEGIAEFPAVREAAFGDEVLEQGVNSQIIELDATRVLVLRLLEHKPSRDQSLDEVRQSAEQAMRRELAIEKLESAAARLLEQARSGEDLERLAKDSGAEWHPPNELTRTGSGVDSAIVSTAFQLPPPAADAPRYGAAALADDRRAVVRLDRITPGDPAEVDDAVKDNIRRALAQYYGGRQSDGMLESLRSRADITVFEDRL